MTRLKTAQPCRHCGDTNRYLRSNTCPTCLTIRHQKYAAKVGHSVIRDKTRQSMAKKGGFIAPPPESECPPKPVDNHCQLCHRRGAYLMLDHCHKTGAFRGWLCLSCNQCLGKIDRIGEERILSYIKNGLSNHIDTRDWLYVGSGRGYAGITPRKFDIWNAAGWR